MKTSLMMTYSLLLILGLLISCSEMNPHPMDMSHAVESATSKTDHEALAKHYEEAAAEMQAKADEHKRLLSQYEAKSYLYGRQAQTFQNHCQSLINAYEQAAVANRGMAEAHRSLAQ